MGLVLTSTDHKLRILEGLGLDMAVIIKFDKRFAAITAEKFLRHIILERFKGLRKVIVGPRAHFGRNAEGDAEYIRRFGEKHGFEVETTDEMVLNDAVVSSSVIRKLVRSGELDTAEAFLGRKYSLFGCIISGRRIGRKLGFPTANIDPQNEVHPPSGVYVVQIKLDHKLFPGVLNIGYRPTIRKRDDLEVAIETHIIGFTEQIYGRSVEIIFHRMLRQEKHFADKDELIAQIHTDVEEARQYLSAK
jgi:riboflavin kinase/FMN adenylyltransferase